jgi:transposase
VWYRSCADEFAKRLVPDGLWEITEPLIPASPRGSLTGPNPVDRGKSGSKIHVLADKAYDIPDCHRALRERRIGDRIARRGIESPTCLGRHRWAVERTIAWLGGYRRLTIRYERHGHLFAAFLALAAAITCYKRLANGDALFELVSSSSANVIQRGCCRVR